MSLDPNDDYYRQQASDAQGQANRSIRDDDRASWLRIAQSWMALISRDGRSAEQTFDDNTKTQGTGQDVSKESE